MTLRDFVEIYGNKKNSINEGFLTNSAKRTAMKFFSKHPGLLEYLKKITGQAPAPVKGQVVESSLEEGAGFNKSIVAIGLALAMAAGMMAKPASASEYIKAGNIQGFATSVSQVQDYKQLIGTSILMPDGTLKEVGNDAMAKKLFDLVQSNVDFKEFSVVISSKAISGTGALSAGGNIAVSKATGF